VPQKLKGLPTHIVFEKAQTMFFLSPGAIKTQHSFLPGLLTGFAKFGTNFSKEVPNENSVTQKVFNENTTRDEILRILF